MSIQSEIDRISDNVSETLSAIAEKGVAVPTDANSDDMADLVRSINTSNAADYIVEQGTSGIWTYRKWNSGIAECWCRYQVNTTVTTAWGSLYVKEIAGKSYPFTFTTAPVQNVNAYSSAGSYFVLPNFNSTTSTGNIYIGRGNSQSSSYTCLIMIHAIGNWK